MCVPCVSPSHIKSNILIKQDVMNSILFAQLAASAQYDRCSQPQDWYESFTDGWIRTSLIDQYIQGTNSTCKPPIYVVLQESRTQKSHAVLSSGTLVGWCACLDMPKEVPRDNNDLTDDSTQLWRHRPGQRSACEGWSIYNWLFERQNGREFNDSFSGHFMHRF